MKIKYFDLKDFALAMINEKIKNIEEEFELYKIKYCNDLRRK